MTLLAMVNPLRDVTTTKKWVLTKHVKTDASHKIIIYEL